MKNILFLCSIIFVIGCGSSRLKIKSVPYYEKERKRIELINQTENKDYLIDYYYFVNKHLFYNNPFESRLDSFVCSNYCQLDELRRNCSYTFSGTKQSTKWYNKRHGVPTEIGEYRDVIRYYQWTVLNNKMYGKKYYCRGSISSALVIEQFICKCDTTNSKASRFIKLKWPDDYFLLPNIK